MSADPAFGLPRVSTAYRGRVASSHSMSEVDRLTTDSAYERTQELQSGIIYTQGKLI